MKDKSRISDVKFNIDGFSNDPEERKRQIDELVQKRDELLKKLRDRNNSNNSIPTQENKTRRFEPEQEKDR